MSKKIAACPECLATADEADFYNYHVVLAMEPIDVSVRGDQVVVFSRAGEWKVDFDSYVPTNSVWRHMGRYVCGKCSADFNYFELLTEEELAWKKMMDSE